ncbi:hypothetical protein [Paenibacillus tyrfis]|uniref:hypothetical protein n=1 Tax=Paenibacillus tyrfis TaxID=1501230 RepID=UPI0020A0FC82|nr:hypothetical protein [Paenibacillus tyrfis]MCP1306424.1 hypothetical protein [Paenibacillus tyrfis]
MANSTGSGWIDARTNRPNKPGEYLVYNIVGREIGRFGEDGKWRVISLDSFDSPEWTVDMTVTHWMDLPEEPKEEWNVRELFRCILCDELKDEVIFTKAERIGGADPELPVIVCEECLDRVDAMEQDET